MTQREAGAEVSPTSTSRVILAGRRPLLFRDEESVPRTGLMSSSLVIASELPTRIAVIVGIYPSLAENSALVFSIAEPEGSGRVTDNRAIRRILAGNEATLDGNLPSYPTVTMATASFLASSGQLLAAAFLDSVDLIAQALVLGVRLLGAIIWPDQNY